MFCPQCRAPTLTRNGAAPLADLPVSRKALYNYARNSQVKDLGQ